MAKNMVFKFYEDNSSSFIAGNSFEAGWIEFDYERQEYVEVKKNGEFSNLGVWTTRDGWGTANPKFGELFIDGELRQVTDNGKVFLHPKLPRRCGSLYNLL